MNSLTIDTAKTLVHSFISCRLDYCNSLLFGISNEQLQRLQSVQNAAARLVTGTRRFDHITPVLVGLHWLPVRYRVSCKLATVVYKCLHGQAPPYLAADCVSVTGRQTVLRSADSTTLVIPRTRTRLGDRAFSVAGPRTWNSLPACIRDMSLTYRQFCKRLKTYMFSEWLRRI